MGDNDEGSLGERLSIPMAGVPVPEDEGHAAADLLSELEPPEELDLLDPDSAELDDAVDALSISNVPPELPPIAIRATPPRPPLPVRRPAGAPPPQRDRISNEPPVVFPPLPSEPPPGRGSGIDFEKVLATAARAAPPKPEPAASLDLVPSVAPMPTVAPEPQRGGGGGRTVLLVVAAAAAAFGLAWWLRAPAAPAETLALGPIETAPSSSSVAEVEPEAPGTTEPSTVSPQEPAAPEAAAPSEPSEPAATTPSPSEPPTPREVATPTLAATRPTSTTGATSMSTPTVATPTAMSTPTPTRSTGERPSRPTSETSVAPRSTTRTEPTATMQAEAAPRPEPPPPVVETPPEDLPEEPTRDEVQGALAAVRPAVQACVTPGAQVRVRITIAGSGRVTTAVVEDDQWSRQPHGGCIARAVRTARFPRFSRDRFVVVFPFQL